MKGDFEGAILQFAGSGPKRSLSGFETRTWPDDFPRCAARMEFDLDPVTARVCQCGVRIAARDLIGEEPPPHRRKRRR